MKSLRVSLIATVFNEAESITDFLSSVCSMSVLPDEFIVVDGGSTDGTPELIRGFDNERLRVQVFIDPGANVARGRNVAFSHSTGDIVAMTDAGSRLDAEWMNEIIRPFTSQEGIDVVGGVTKMDPRSSFERWISLLHKSPEQLDLGKYLPSARTLAVRREIWMRAGGFSEHLTMWAEDTLFLETLKRLGARFSIVPTAIVYWRPRGSLQEYWIQYVEYGFGDGEARLYPKLYLKRVILSISPFVLLAGMWFGSVSVVLLAVAVLGFAFMKLAWPLKSAKVAIWRLPMLFGLILVSETAQVFGYVAGRLRRGGADE